MSTHNIMLPPVTPQQLKLCRALLRHPDHWKRYEYLIDVVWGDDPDGGPENPSNGLRVMVFNLRKRLAAKGVVGEGEIVETSWGMGYRLAPDCIDQVRELLEPILAEPPAIARDPAFDRYASA